MHHSKRNPLEMIFFALIAFFHPPTVAESISEHLSQTLKLKCDSLPYRSDYIDDRCYFAVFQEGDQRNASDKCSSILNSAKAVMDVPASIFERIMVDKSAFLRDDSGVKNMMCTYETGYKCDAPEAILKSGRCFVRAPKKMDFENANIYCSYRDMQIPAPSNDLDNCIVRDILVERPGWVQKSLQQVNGFKWAQERGYSRWNVCDDPVSNSSVGSCKTNKASVIEQNGYWRNAAVRTLMDVVCVKNAENDFMKGEKTMTTTPAPRTTTTPLCYDVKMSNKVIYNDKEFYCDEQHDLRVTAKNANYTGFAVKRTNYSCDYWKIRGQTNWVLEDLYFPTYIDCVPSVREFDKSGKCGAPAVTNGHYANDRIVCDKGMIFNHATDKDSKHCWYKTVLECKGGHFACPKLQRFDEPDWKGVDLTHVVCRQ